MSGNFKEKLFEARRILADSEYMKQVAIGPIDHFHESDLVNTTAKIALLNDEIILLECPHRPHSRTAIRLGSVFENSLNEQCECNEDVFEAEGDVTFNNYRDRFNCTRRHAKTPDNSISLSPNASDALGEAFNSSPITFEIAFKNESFALLLKELSNWISPATSTLLSVGVKIHVSRMNEEFQGATIVVLSRESKLAGAVLPMICTEWPGYTENNFFAIPDHEVDINLHCRLIYRKFISKVEWPNIEGVPVDLSDSEFCAWGKSNGLFAVKPLLIDLWPSLKDLPSLFNK